MDNPLKSSSNWIGEEDEALKGFSFRSGSKSKNTEMVIWSDVFLDNNQRDGDLAIILMDTQGFFKKGERTFTPNSRTFSIGSLVGSVLILNLNSHIKLEEMKYLEMSTAYTKDTLKCHQTPFSKPFQNLNFILRNWSNIEQFPFGLNVGNQFIMKSFDNTQCIKNIKSSFENINSFLMPFPGNTIRLKKSTGCWSEMNVEYKKQLQLLIEHILAPERLEIKKVNGVQMTGAKLNEKIKAHFKAIQSKVLVDEYTKIYKQELTKTFRAADPMNEKSFKSSHLSSKERVQAMKKISNSDLASYLNEAFDEAFKEMNYNQTKFNELNVTIKNELFKHKHGEALNVICFDGENKEIRINDTVVSSLMDHLIIRDRKVVVVSMTGLYRHGKSTFMDYCLRYLYAHVRSFYIL